MSNNYIIRKAKSDDLNSILNLYSQFKFSEILPDLDYLKKLWDKILKTPSLHYFVLEYMNNIVSTCNMTIILNLTHGASPYALIENVITDKKYRNKGFAKDVLNFALEYAKIQKCYKVMLLTGSKDEYVLNFYEKVGFKRNIKTGFIVYP